MNVRLYHNYNHYEWLKKYFLEFVELIGFEDDLRGLISAHGDKCSCYRYLWEENNVPFDHGVAIYLLTYIRPFGYLVRETKKGWVKPEQWIVDNYCYFKPFLPKSWEDKLKGITMLDQSQKTFIENKVRELGSLQAVKDFYCEKNGKLSAIDKYARKIANKLYGRNKK